MYEQEEKETIVTRSQIVWCGNDGVLRAKTIFHPNSPIDIRHVDMTKLPNEVDKGIGVSWSSMAQPAHGDCISPNTLGINETGEMRLIPDKYSVCYQKGIKSMVYHAYMYEAQNHLKPLYFCPRSILEKVHSGLERRGFDIHIGFETEFAIFNDKCSGISVRQYHKESGNGQFEINSGVYSDPLMACDAMLMTRKIISQVANKKGFVASFLPKLSDDLGTNSTHIHMSMHTRGKGNITHEILELAKENNNDWSGGIESNSHAVNFLSGILKHLPGLLALTCPTHNSFRRLVRGNWAGAHLCWGIDNREAPLRLCEMHQLEDVNLEYKAFDATANPYIVSGLAGIIAAGMDGIEQRYPLPPPVQVLPSSTDPLFISTTSPLLPRDPSESILRLQTDPWKKPIREALGEDAISLITAVRSCEAEYFEQQSSLEREVEILFDKY